MDVYVYVFNVYVLLGKCLMFQYHDKNTPLNLLLLLEMWFRSQQPYLKTMGGSDRCQGPEILF